MAEPITIARPYAEAAFGLAKERGEIDKWSEALSFIGSVYEDPQMTDALANPKVTSADVESLLLAVCGEKIDGAARNFIQLLVRNGRLEVLPEIRHLFEKRKAEDDGVVEASISSAFPLEGAQLDQIVSLLAKRYGKKISPAVAVNPDLIGGIMISVGDKVWDTSVRGRLQDMAAALTK